MDFETSPRRLSSEVFNALCAALGYLESCISGDTPPDKVFEVLLKVREQAERALEAEMELFRAIGADKYPVVQ